MKQVELVSSDKIGNGTNAAPDILAICCEHCAQSAAALAGAKRIQYPVGVRIMPVPCSGNIEMEHILDAFENGVDGILVDRRRVWYNFSWTSLRSGLRSLTRLVRDQGKNLGIRPANRADNPFAIHGPAGIENNAALPAPLPSGS